MGFSCAQASWLSCAHASWFSCGQASWFPCALRVTFLDWYSISGQLEVNVEFLIQIDKLVQLIESPIFTCKYTVKCVPEYYLLCFIR